MLFSLWKSSGSDWSLVGRYIGKSSVPIRIEECRLCRKSCPAPELWYGTGSREHHRSRPALERVESHVEILECQSLRVRRRGPLALARRPAGPLGRKTGDGGGE